MSRKATQHDYVPATGEAQSIRLAVDPGVELEAGKHGIDNPLEVFHEAAELERAVGRSLIPDDGIRHLEQERVCLVGSARDAAAESRRGRARVWGIRPKHCRHRLVGCQTKTTRHPARRAGSMQPQPSLAARCHTGQVPGVKMRAAYASPPDRPFDAS